MAAPDSILVVHDTIALAVRDTLVRIAAPQTRDTLSVAVIPRPWAWVKDLVSVLLPLATFLLGQWAESRKQERIRREAEDQLKHEISTGVSNIDTQLQAIKSEIDAGREFSESDLEELKRRIHVFEPIIRRLNVLRDQDYATKAYVWYGEAQTTPGHLRTLVGPNRDEAQEIPAFLVDFLKEIKHEARTKGQVAEGVIAHVLAEGQRLGPTIQFYSNGEAVIQRVTTGQYNPQFPPVDMRPVRPETEKSQRPEDETRSPK